MIRRLVLVLMALVCATALAPGAEVETYQLVMGGPLTGEPIHADARGLVVKTSDGSFAPRVAWTNFTEGDLKKLANLPMAKQFVESYLEPEEEPGKKEAVEIKPKPVPRMERPDPSSGLGAIFGSPLSLTLLILVYIANIYAGYEVALFRNYAPGVVCLAAAVVPVIAPIIFLCLPTHIQRVAMSDVEAQPEYVSAGNQTPAFETPEAQVPAGVASEPGRAKPHLPPPTIYQRGHTTFNRRFFETKLSGFLRVVPSEAEKDMIILIKSARGEYIGQRISRVMPNEIYLQVSKGGASSDVILPFSEITEVQVRHKDA
jgi:hypothetical protein